MGFSVMLHKIRWSPPGVGTNQAVCLIDEACEWLSVGSFWLRICLYICPNLLKMQDTAGQVRFAEAVYSGA